MPLVPAINIEHVLLNLHLIKLNLLLLFFFCYPPLLVTPRFKNITILTLPIDRNTWPQLMGNLNGKFKNNSHCL